MPCPERTYDVFGVCYACTEAHARTTFDREFDVYPRLKEAFESCGWLFNRVETAQKDGFPDIIVAKGDDYFFVEVKMLHKRVLKDIAEDLKWQFGQLAFLKKADMRGVHYLLVVAKEDRLFFIRRNHAAFDIADVIERL